MRRFSFPRITGVFCSIDLLIICFLFCLALSFAFTTFFSEALFPTMRMAISSRVSIIGLLGSLLVPAYISAYAVCSNESWIIIILVCIKAFTFGFCSAAITIAYKNAWWLTHYLILFSDIYLLCVLWWFWLRRFPSKCEHLCLSTSVATAAALFIGIMDFLLITPFCACLQQ